MPSPDDFYEILQVSPNADDDVIQAAYKRLAFKWHPDKQPGNEFAADKMKQLNTAYEVLSNPQKRRQYDLKRQARFEEAIPEETPAPPPPPRRKKIRRGPNDRLRKKKPIDIRGDSVVQGLAVCLVGMSFADLLMTYLLLRSGSQFYEANPIALWFFNRWNILGMTLFKFVIVGVVIALAEVIERSRQRWGRLLLMAACGATGYAVVRGLRLYVGFED